MSLTLTKHESPIASIITKKKTKSKGKYVYVNYDLKDKVKQMDANENECFFPEAYKESKSKQRYDLYCSGCSGSGKTIFVSNMVKELLKKKAKQIVLFSAKDDADPAFDDFMGYVLPKENKHDEEQPLFMQINIKNPDLPSALNDITTLKNKICIFDDYDKLEKSLHHKSYVYIRSIILQLLDWGRKYDVDMIMIHHVAQDYHKTKSIITECQNYAFFPSDNLEEMKRFIESYITKNKQVIKMITEEWEYRKFDYLYIHRSSPRYIITNRHIFLL